MIAKGVFVFKKGNVFKKKTFIPKIDEIHISSAGVLVLKFNGKAIYAFAEGEWSSAELVGD